MIHKVTGQKAIFGMAEVNETLTKDIFVQENRKTSIVNLIIQFNQHIIQSYNLRTKLRLSIDLV